MYVCMPARLYVGYGLLDKCVYVSFNKNVPKIKRISLIVLSAYSHM